MRPTTWAFLALAGCQAFGPADDKVVVPIERSAEAASPERATDAPVDAREAAERVWALVQLGELDQAEAQCARAEGAPSPAGDVRQRALLQYRCGRVAEGRRDSAARTRRLDAAFALYASPRIARAIGPDPDRAPWDEASLVSVRERLAALGARDAADFVPVDGPVTVGAWRAASFERCARPSEVCQGALVTLGPDGHAVDALLFAYGAAPGSLELLAVPGSRVVAMRGDLPAQLRVGLFLAARLDAGRITPVALVHATSAQPDRAALVRLVGDALVIDETANPWDARLRLFRGAPVAASPP